MIDTLIKIDHYLFTDYYEGEKDNKRVICVLDNNCVRYVGFLNGKRVTRREYDNNNKDMCMARAIAWLNK